MTQNQEQQQRTTVALEAVRHERVWQEEHFNAGRFKDHVSDPATPDERRLMVLLEEVGEVAKELVDRKDFKHLCSEVTHVAAVAVAWLEALDSVKYREYTSGGSQPAAVVTATPEPRLPGERLRRLSALVKMLRAEVPIPPEAITWERGVKILNCVQDVFLPEAMALLDEGVEPPPPAYRVASSAMGNICEVCGEVFKLHYNWTDDNGLTYYVRCGRAPAQ